MASAANILSKLYKTPSWKLEKISPSTHQRDILIKLSDMSQKQIHAIAALLKAGTCFRCRIGKGRYWYAATISEAAKLALDGTKVK